MPYTIFGLAYGIQRQSSRRFLSLQSHENKGGSIMAPDRGGESEGSLDELDSVPVDTPLLPEHEYAADSRQRDSTRTLEDRANDDTHLTIRGVLVGSVIGIIICFSNTYFGLQTGWISGMAMPGKIDLRYCRVHADTCSFSDRIRILQEHRKVYD